MPFPYVSLNRQCLAFALAGAWALSSMTVADEAKPKDEPTPVVIDPSKPSNELLKQRPPGGLIFTIANIPAAKGVAAAKGAAAVNPYTWIAIDPETGKWTTVSGEGRPVFSVAPNGQTIAYELGNALWTRSVAGDDEPKKILNLAGPGNGGVPVWSSDGKRLIVSLGDRDPLEQRMVYLHVQLNADGTDVTELPLPRGFLISDWSSDGRRIIGTSPLSGAPLRNQLSVIHPDGSDLRALNDVADAASLPRTPRFSRDGRHVIYMDGSGMWVIDTDGKNLRKLASADGRYFGVPAWSPDDARFAVVTRPLNSQNRPISFTLEIIALDDRHRVARFQLPVGSTGGYIYWR